MAEFAGRALGRVTEADAVARFQALGGPGKGAPRVRCDAQVQVHRDAGGALAPDAKAIESGRDHAGVVEHERVAGPEQHRQIAHDPALRRAIGAHHEQAGSVARAGRPQRDPVGGKLEIEQVDAHG